MSRKHILILVACVVIALGGHLAVRLTAPDQPMVRTSGTALVGGPINLTGHDGAAVTDEQFRGKYMLVFFGYTFCPDACPAGLQVMTTALEELGTAADNIQPLFISFDPERDTVQVMAEYVQHFHPRLIGLTGTSAQVAEVAKAYRVYYKKAGDDADYLMDHSNIVYLMGPDGKFVKHFASGSDAAALAKGISQAMGTK